MPRGTVPSHGFGFGGDGGIPAHDGDEHQQGDVGQDGPERHDQVEQPGALLQLLAVGEVDDQTHEGADKMFTTLSPEMKKYSEAVREIMDNVWDNEEYHNWAAKWESMCGIPVERFEARRQAYEASRGRGQNRK